MKALPKILLSVALGLVALEAGLRIVGFAYERLHARDDASAASRRILCIGDSHTFGIWLAKGDSYPARLEAKLNEANPNKANPNDRVAVENAGVPGYATADVLERLRALLARRHYDAVAVMAGANDRWKGAERPWWLELKTVKLGLLLFRGRVPPRVTNSDGVVHVDEISGKATPGNASTVTIAMVDRSGESIAFEQRATAELESDERLAAKLAENLRAIAGATAAAGSRILFVGYPSDANDLGLASRAMAAAAVDANIPFVDLAPAMAIAREKFLFEQLYFPITTGAPRRTKSWRGRSPRRSPTRGRVAPESWESPRGAADRRAADGADRARGEPRVGARDRLPHRPGAPRPLFLGILPGVTDVLGHRIPLERDALFEKTVDPARPTIAEGVADKVGIARVSLAEMLGPEAKIGVPIHAVAAIFGREGDAGLHEITPAKQLSLR